MDASRHLHHSCSSFVPPAHQENDLSKMWGATENPQTWGMWSTGGQGRKKLKNSKWAFFQPPLLDHPRKNSWVSNLPVEFAYGAGYSQCESKFYYFDGHNMQQGQQKDMRIFKRLTSSSALPGGFQPWTWLLGLGFNVEESPWMAQTTFTSMKTGKGMIWEVTGGKEWVLKFWLCEMRKKYITKKQRNIRKRYQINKEAKSWQAGCYIWVQTTATIPVCPSDTF